ncbi:aldo/keto reductase [Anaeromyxobacter oryzae]|uniref:Oxidoreductase n=1 Tax=Anaeromyxobacter oryzae TaxID=2918170 RepID=A0ABN6N1A0_9BACT|nr:aldo/keto reductase [Anaeromyxobacter oryzae]BDG05623.1 oxidoreductase [Anaeromyxobacter oryzae]
MSTQSRRLGRSDIELTPVGLGTWQFSKGRGLVGGFWKSLDDEATTAVVAASLERGVSWFDTAEIYGRGESERSLARALTTLKVTPGSVRIATKWWPMLRTAGNIPRTIDERLECLSPWAIDLYQIHQPFSLSSVAKQIDAMGDLVEAGKVGSVGVSNFSANAMEEAHAVLARRGIPLVSNQVRISLLDRSIERNGVLEAARRLGITLIAYSPLAQGVLTGRFHDDPAAVASVSWGRRVSGSLGPAALKRTRPLVEELQRIAAAHGATPSQVALSWVVSFWGDVVVAIPGASKPSQATEAAAAMNLDLGRDELERLDRLSRQT